MPAMTRQLNITVPVASRTKPEVYFSGDAQWSVPRRGHRLLVFLTGSSGPSTDTMRRCSFFFSSSAVVFFGFALWKSLRVINRGPGRLAWKPMMKIEHYHIVPQHFLEVSK